MIEKLRIFGLLLYKGWLFRKSNLKLLALEILLPFAFGVFWILATANLGSWPGLQIKLESHYAKIPLDKLISATVIYSNIMGFATEIEFITFYYEGKFNNSVAVIFDESIDQSVKHLHYKLRTTGAIMPLYNDKARPENMTLHYLKRRPHLAQMQVCLDRSFVNMKSGKKTIPKTYIQQVPYPAHNYTTEATPFNDENRTTFTYFVIIILMLPLGLGIMEVVNEEKTGVRVLLSFNGVSSTLYLVSLITERLLFLSVFCVIPYWLLLTNSPYVHYGNPLILFLVFIFYLAHLLTFSIHVSAYWSCSSLVTIALVIFNFMTIILRVKTFTDDTLYLVPYLVIIFPDGLFYHAMEEISSYEIKAEGIQWYNVFTSTNPAIKGKGSVGGVLILSVIGTMFHLLLAIHVYTISPGKYGAATHPVHISKFKTKNRSNSQEHIESLEYNGMNQYFESIPTGTYVPGIQIRNLQKSYKINPFSKQKIHALRGVSVDFYKGQITALLGHSGAGKTTLISILTGLTNPTEGKVFIDFKDSKENTSQILKDMRVCTQENLYFSKLSVWNQILIIARVKGRGKSRSSIRSDVEALLRKLRLFDKKDNMPKTLSDGEKRLLCIGLVLVSDSSILILDEPTSGMDSEQRRIIWDTLLEMRGQKTILISTHDAEEAEVLGDRIAIIHAGQLISYGSSQFLKRLIGRNNVEVICSIRPRSDPERIRRELHKDGIISSIGTNKVIISIPNSPGLPDTLDSLEKRKKELDILGFSVSFIGLERVFLKITQENDDPSKSYQEEVITLTGIALYMQTVRALLSKNLPHTLKDRRTRLLKIFMTLVTVLAIAIVWIPIARAVSYEKPELTPVPVKLDMYPQPEVLYTSYEKNFGNQYKSISQRFGGNAIEVTNSSLESALLQRAKDNLTSYDNYLIAAAEFNKTIFNAFYSGMATFSLPISINLLSNIILKNLGDPECSLSLSIQGLPDRFDSDKSVYIRLGVLLFALIFNLMIAIFVLHPSRESTTGMKQLQKRTGISGFTYWGTTFLVDLIEYAFLVVLAVVGFVCLELLLGLQLFGPNEILIEILLLMLFAVSVLPFVYTFSFIKKKASHVYMYTTTTPILTVAIGYLFPTSDAQSSFRTILMVIPQFNFELSQIFFFVTAYTNARCSRLPNDFYDKWCQDENHRDIWCDLNCYDGKCKQSKQFFDDADVNLTTSLTSFRKKIARGQKYECLQKFV